MHMKSIHMYPLHRIVYHFFPISLYISYFSSGDAKSVYTIKSMKYSVCPFFTTQRYRLPLNSMKTMRKSSLFRKCISEMHHLTTIRFVAYKFPYISHRKHNPIYTPPYRKSVPISQQQPQNGSTLKSATNHRKNDSGLRTTIAITMARVLRDFAMECLQEP